MADLVPPPGGAARLVAGAARALGNQIPDEVLRFGRRAAGATSLRRVVEGRTVMITGASSGIGLAAAQKVGACGGRVLLVARTPEKLEAAREEIAAAGGEAHVHPCDLADVADIERMGEEVLERHGHVDVLVNNAGRSIRRSLALSYDRFHDFERTIQLNYLGAVRLILLLVPRMRERRYGQIVNISSIGVQTNTPRFSAYVASKAALDAFSRSVASEMVDDNVKITTIHMPLVRTPMIAPTGMYKSFPTLSPDEAADLIADAIVHRPKRIATPLGTLGQLLYAANPKSMDVTLGTAYKLFPDSSAARGGGSSAGDGSGASSGEGDAPDDDLVSRSAQVFAQLLRGVHW
ncbi:MAG TPA: SDR family NAD(P)-dependent oxidoreductase [Solirubrobacteraceae bacterium]|nr:SDR family NAD(P)-dependent oxidoreductase [Solirubrobacteraceae bacterium]